MIEPISDVEDLRRHLQWAVEVEHSTIPPYEYAMWSVVDPDSAAATSIKYVVREEMLHAALAANLLNAVGGRPRFTGEAVPRYPEPMRHHDPKLPLVLHLAPASVDLVRQVFLRIEQPEEPGARPEADRYETLAQFYEAIGGALVRLGDEVFTGDPRAQVTKGYAGHGGGTLFAVTDLDSALLAIEVTVEQARGPTRRRPPRSASTARFARRISSSSPSDSRGLRNGPTIGGSSTSSRAGHRSAPSIRCGSTPRQTICPTASSANYHGCSMPVTRSR